MRSLQALLLLALIALSWDACVGSRTPLDSDKELIMLEIEQTPRDDRTKRSPDGGLRFVRQAHAIPREYLNLLQQLSPQQQQQIQQLVVARDGSKPSAAQYVLSQDGRVVQETQGLSALQQQQLQQQQLLQQYQLPQPQPQQPGRPPISPELEAFSQLQTQLQQDYHDAPIRAQIAGQTERPDPLADSLRSPLPGGPGSPSPQIFSQAANQALARHEARLRSQFQAPTFGGQQPADPNAYFQQLAEQQYAQQFGLPQAQRPEAQSVASADTGRQLTSIYEQAPRQRVVYQAAQPQSQPQQLPAYTPKQPTNRRPIGASSQAQLGPSTQPQLLRQAAQQAQLLQPSHQAQFLPPQQPQPQLLQQQPQQYLVETTRPSLSAVRYVDPTAQEEREQDPQSEGLYASLFANSGRGLFSPAIPEKQPRPSVYAGRPASKAPAPTEEQLPTVRLPASQRALSRAELDALVNAGFSITPVGSEEAQPSFLKAKRAPVPLERRNHVVYQNQQDGVSYQYSPGSSEYNPTKAKRFAPKLPSSPVYRADNGEGMVTYVLALNNPSA